MVRGKDGICQDITNPMNQKGEIKIPVYFGKTDLTEQQSNGARVARRERGEGREEGGVAASKIYTNAGRGVFGPWHLRKMLRLVSETAHKCLHSISLRYLRCHEG